MGRCRGGVQTRCAGVAVRGAHNRRRLDGAPDRPPARLPRGLLELHHRLGPRGARSRRDLAQGILQDAGHHDRRCRGHRRPAAGRTADRIRGGAGGLGRPLRRGGLAAPSLPGLCGATGRLYSNHRRGRRARRAAGTQFQFGDRARCPRIDRHRRLGHACLPLRRTHRRQTAPAGCAAVGLARDPLGGRADFGGGSDARRDNAQSRPLDRTQRLQVGL